MNLTEELHNIERAYGKRPDVGSDPLWYAQLAISFEMGKRIEALEQREHSHPLGVGSLQLSMADNEPDSIH